MPVWIAFAFTFLPLIAFLPTIESAPVLSALLGSTSVVGRDELLLQRAGPGRVPLIGFLTAALIFGFGMRGRRSGHSQHESPKLTPWHATALYLLAATPVTAMLMAKFVTHGFSPRYAICSIVGVATLAAYLLARAAPRPLTAMGAAALCLIMYGVEIRILAADYVEQRGHLADASRVLSGSGDTQIALMDITVMHWLSFYAPRELATRVNYVADPAGVGRISEAGHGRPRAARPAPLVPPEGGPRGELPCGQPALLRLRFSRRLVLDPLRTPEVG